MVTLNLRDDCNGRVATNFKRGMTDKRFLELEITAWLTSPERKKQLEGEAYYDGYQDVTHRERLALDEDGKPIVLKNLPNNRLVNNLYSKMVDQKTNYSFGRPLSFDTENKEYAKALGALFGARFLRTMHNVGEGAWIGGKSWLYPYYENGELAFRRFPADEVLPFWADADHTVLDAAVHVYVVQEYDEAEHAKDVVKVEVMHRVTCETAGAHANGYTGQLIPIEYVDGLTHAELVELLIPGDDEEDTEVFRQRVLDSFKSQAFGGNQADYIEKVKAMPGISAVKVHPVWNGDIAPSTLIPDATVTAWYTSAIAGLSEPVAAWLTAVYTAALNKKLTVGGTVKLVLLASNNTAPSETLIDEVQTAVDPTENAGEGLGLAPIGHVVHVTGVEPVPVSITLNLTYASGWNWGAIKSYVEAVIDDYFAELAGTWATSDHLTIRISQIESRILSECSDMITDIADTQINGKEENLVLGADSIPVRGDING